MFWTNSAIQVSRVKTPKTETTPQAKGECTHKDPEQIAQIAMDFVTHTAKAVGAVIVTYAVATALTRIADNLTKKDDHE
jgi:hypothetical protein